MIQLSDLSMVFYPGTVNENRAINKINLKVNQGDFITIVGSNGSGKTTLFNLISGNLTANSGKILFKDKDITHTAEHIRAKQIGRIFQDPTLGTSGSMTLEDNMMICSKKGFKGLKISLNNKKREAFALKLKDLKMDLDTRLKDNVGLLSGGQRQALTLLMMVLSNPDLVLLDEHTAALDPRNAQIVMDQTLKFIEEYNLTTMMITHNMNHAIKYGNRLLMMDRGEIILDISGEEKKSLTVEALIKKFHAIRNEEFGTDEILLS